MFVPRQLKKKAANSITSGELHIKTKPPSTGSLRPAAPLWHSSTIVAGVKPQKEPDQNDDLLLCGLSLALSDLQRASSNSKQWFQERERSIDGQHGYIHLSTLLDHPIFVRLKTPPTQRSLQSAVQVSKLDLCELSRDGYHIRPSHRAETVQLLTTQEHDARTVYVEPHLSTLASNAPGLVLHLLRHSKLPASILPVQLCTSRHPSWAFMTFSGPLVEADSVIQKETWPPDWIVMTKAEHTRRTDEYLALKAASRQSSRSSPQGPTTPVPSRNPRSTSSATNTSTRISKQSQPCSKESKIPYPTGTLVHLHPLPLRVTKPALTAFLSHNVSVWSSKRASIGQSKRDPASQLRIAHIVLRPSATADATSATVRCCTDVDAENLIDAMEARGRRMVDAEDAKGVKAGEGERLKPELLRGDRERAFWEELRASTTRRELKIERQMKRKREGDDDEI